jgi:hypothetical protein
MTEAHPTEDLVTVEKEGDAWRIRAAAWGSFCVTDRKIADLIFNIAQYCHAQGRERAFGELRKLIGVEHG